MPSTQPVSFTSPGFDYGADLASIERKRKLAAALQAQSFEPIQTGSVNGIPSPISWTQGAAKLAQAWASGKQAKAADEEQRALSTKAQDEYKNMLTSGLNKLQGSPVSEDASGNVTPAQGPDPMGAMAAFGSHPMGAQFMPLAMSEISRQRLAESLRAGYKPPQANPMAPGPGSSVMAGSGSTVPQNAPQQAGVSGGPAGGQPMDFWLQVDPSGKLYAEQLAKDHMEAQKPVVNRGFGLGRMVNGQYQPDQASLDQALALEKGKTGITAPLEPPVSIKTSSGQDIQLSRPEYAEYQKSGQLPARYGQQAPQQAEPLPANVPPEHAAAYQTVLDASRRGVTASAKVTPGQPKLGTVGATQPQEDVIRQARQQAGGKAVDEAFAKDYVAFTTGGAQDAMKQLGQLKDVIGALGEPKANLTGPFLGRTPDVVKSFTNPKSIAMRERVEEVVQRSLRAILGAQFTEKEGERLIARAYNPSLGEGENSIRVGRLFTQLEQAYKSKQDAAQYFQANGTLEGWNGKLPSLADFDPEKSGNLVNDVVKSGAPKVVNWSDLGR